MWLLGGVHGCWGSMCRIRQDTVNEQVVRILLECILVSGCALKAGTQNHHVFSKLGQ